MKFFNLLKKELREMINAQFIVGLIVSASILAMMGGIMDTAMEEASQTGGELTVCDEDGTDFTENLLSNLEAAGYSIRDAKVTQEDRAALMKELGADSLLIIPEGFTAQILEQKTAGQLETVTVIKTASAMSALSDSTAAAMTLIDSFITQYLLYESGMSEQAAQITLQPVVSKDITVVADNSAEINSMTLVSFLSSQGMVVPLVIFILVMFTSQMILTAVATEKIDKTLETLLSAPVSRLSIVGAKMLAASIVALMNAAVYMVGFSSYIGSSLTSALGDGTLTNSIGEALTMNDILNQLGVNLTAGSYVLIGLQMFLTVLIALCVAMILGALATDIKAAQTLLMPIMICAMVPYIISMVSDVNTLSTPIRVLVYAIPFTHTFSAMSNVMFSNMTAYWLGLGYQLLFFIICLIAVLKIFTSDKIFTISLSMNQKWKNKKAAEKT